MKRKRILLIIAVFCLLLSGVLSVQAVPPNLAQPKIGDSIEAVTSYSQDGLRLIADPQTGEIRVENEQTGYAWYSNPTDRENDKVAAGFNKMNLSSQLVVTYLDKNGQTDSTNNFVGSIRKSAFTCEKIENGFRFVFTFPSENFVIPVEYTLANGALVCNIPIDEVEESGEDRLCEIQLLPLFGAGASSESGYILLPDGCGALIEFGCSQAKAKVLGGYKSFVYGRDPVLTTTTVVGQTETLLMPMFGVKKDEAAFLAIIESGDALSMVTAMPNNKESSYATVSPTLVYRNTDNAILREMKSSEKSILVYDETPVSLENYTVSYHFLSGGDANYSGMAQVARRYYETLGMDGTAGYTGTYLELTAGARMSDYFLGIPMQRYTAFTTLSQARDIVAYLNDSGVEQIAVKYDSLFSGGEQYKMTQKAKVERKVRDMGLKAFLSDIANAGNRMFPTVDLLKIHASSSGVSKKNDAVRNVSGGIFTGYTFLRSTTRKDTSAAYYTIAKASVFSDLVTAYCSAMNKRGFTNYADLTSGNLLPSDHHRSVFSKQKPTDRQQVLNTYIATYESITDQSDFLMFDRACGYVFPYATDLTSVPMQSSRYELFTKDVPFVQMVLHGKVAYSSQSVNICDNTDVAMLKCLEYGSTPLFSLVYEGMDRLAASAYNERFSSSYFYWRDQIVAYNTRYELAYKQIAGRTMLQHMEVQDGVYVTQYAGGVSVAVNYTDALVELNGHSVEAGGFLIWEE